MAKKKVNAKLAAKQVKLDQMNAYLEDQGIGAPVVQADQKTVADFVNNPSFGVANTPHEEFSEFTPEESSAISNEISLDQKYGDNPLATAQAAGAGLVRGALPAGDIVLTKGFGVSPEKLRELKERHEIISPVAEITGLVGSAAISGGLGGAVNLTERAVANQISKNVFKNAAEKGIAKKILEKSLEKGVAGAVSGAALGINQLVNEDALGEAELNGENLLAYGGAGAVLNGMVGGAFGAMEAAVPKVNSTIDHLTGQAKRKIQKYVDFDQNLADLAGNTNLQRSKIMEDISSIDKDVKANYVKEKWNLKQMDSAEEMVEKHVAAGEKIGNDLQTAYKMVDQNVPQGAIPVAQADEHLTKAFNDFKKENIDFFDSSAGKSLERQFKRELANKTVRMGERETAENFWKTVQNFGEQAKGYWRNPAESPIKAEMYAQMNRAGREFLQGNIQTSTTGTAVEGILGDIRKLNTEYRLWSSLDKGLSKKGVSSKDFLTLKDSIWGLGALASGNPGLFGSLALGKKALESDMRRKFVVLNAIQSSNDRFTEKLGSAVSDFFTKTSKAAKAVGKGGIRSDLARSGFALSKDRKEPKDHKEAYTNIKNNLIDLHTSDINSVALKTTSPLMKVYEAAPKSAAIAQGALTRSINFLAQKLPKSVNESSDVINKTQYQPNEVELAKFARYVKIVENPYSALDELKDGTLTREHVEALQVVYPRIYSEIRHTVMDEIGKNEDYMAYNKRIQIGLLLDLPTDASLNPMNIAGLQANFAGQTQSVNGAVKTTQGGTANIDKAERMSTGMQKAQGGIKG